MDSLNFYSAFCFDGHAAVASELEKRNFELVEDMDTLIIVPEMHRQAEKTLTVGVMIFLDILSSIPIVAQIRGICTLLISPIFLRGPDEYGRHSFGRGLIARGILEFCNLGLVLLITDIAFSALKTHSMIVQ
jgi:hypothetical protein